MKGQKIRNTYSEFVYEILNFEEQSRESIINSGKILGFWDEGKMVFEDEEESNVLTEYLLYEYRINGKRIIDRFHVNNENLISEKQEILRGMIKNRISLFEIIDVDKTNSMVKLKDQIKNEVHELMDINLSLSASIGMIISTRLIPVYNVKMTSGLTFQFRKEKRLNILTELSEAKTEYFEAIFRISKKYGIQVESIET